MRQHAMNDEESVTSPSDHESKNGPIFHAGSLLTALKRLCAANDNMTYRTSGGLRVMIRHEPDEEEEISFDVSIVIEEEHPSIEKALKNEIDIVEDESGCIVIEDYAFESTDTEALKGAMDFLNAVDLWTVCPCGEYLIKDKNVTHDASMCYYCEMTHDGQHEDIFCPICHESGNQRWMITTPCCTQKMHKKCKEACITSDGLRDIPSRCPMCRAESWLNT